MQEWVIAGGVTIQPSGFPGRTEVAEHIDQPVSRKSSETAIAKVQDSFRSLVGLGAQSTGFVTALPLASPGFGSEVGRAPGLHE